MDVKWNIDPTWCLFLDRDGVINKRKIGGYIQKIDEFHFLDKVPETIAQLSKHFLYIFVVTNQQGIGKKLMTANDLHKIHQYMMDKIATYGGNITKCYYAPNLNSENNMLRKPNTGMAKLAKQDYPEINFLKSIMVGDSDSDILFGQRMGMKTVRILNNETPVISADLTINSLEELPKWLL